MDGLGRAVVAGSFGSVAADTSFCAIRLTPEGVLDSTFGFGGLSVIAFADRPEGIDTEFGSAIAFQSGRVVTAGDLQLNPEYEYRVGILRLEVSLIFADGLESASTGLWSAPSFVQ